MSRIQSSVGLISGIPIQDTIDKLMSLAAQPRVTLEGRVAQLKAQKLAVTELTALVIGVQLSVKRLGSAETFSDTTVRSSDDEILSATVSGKPALGTYQYTPVRQAQSHQLLSQGFATKSTTVGAGELSLQFGGRVNTGMRLEDLNGGEGVQRGKIRITDRSGSSGIVDLRYAVTIDDVLKAINENNDIRVTASAVGDRIRLTDESGQTTSNLQVQEIGASTTAADLGLGGVNAAASEVTGDDLVRLFDRMQLQSLNDGNGVTLRKSVADLRVDLRDGTILDVDFLGLKKGDTEATGTTNAENGVNAQIKITSTGTGATYDGYTLVFQDDEDVTAGNEVVEVDAAGKRITVKIDAGQTRAAEVIAKLNANTSFSASFTAAPGDGGNGTGVVDVEDTLTTKGGAPEYYNETTLGDLIESINRVDPARLQARISSSGDSLELVDLTAGGGTFAVSSPFSGSLAEELGFTNPAVGGVITSEPRLAGLQDVLLSTLGGGYGLGTLGSLSLTNRAGVTTSVDLSSTRILAEVIDEINTAGAGITARVNDNRNGIVLTDTTGGSNALIVANGDATNTADKLKLTANVNSSTVDSGSLQRRTFNANLSLGSLRNGRGIGKGSFLITDSNGQIGAVNLTVLNAQTVGDVIDGINALGIGVTARINDTGDGLLLLDTAGGTGQLTVTDVGTGTAAKDLKIAGTGVTTSIQGTPTQVLDGSYTTRITLDSDDTVQDLVNKINEVDGDFTASLINSGSGSTPFRFAISSKISGVAGELLVDGTQLGIAFQETVAAQDALLLSGSPDASIVGPLISSPTNDFAEVVDGVRLTINAPSDKQQTITVERTADSTISKIKLFVEQYNKLQDKIREVASFNPENSQAGVLFAKGEILQIDLGFGSALTSRYFATGSIQSFAEVGLSVDSGGDLEFDEQKFRDRHGANAAAVEQFFTTASTGAAARIDAAAERLAGRDSSVLLNRATALQRMIDTHQRKITAMNTTLERQREQMLKEFSQLELVIAKMQTNLSSISRLQPLQIS
ncbi:MAG: flagellar filament capping protein FliD [Pirellulaceae bacterium]